jgi:outer membrane protein
MSVSPKAYGETLQEAFVSAYTNNPRLMAERARVREFDENYIQARAQGRMTSSLSGSLGYSGVRLPNTGFAGQPIGGYSTSFTEPASLQLQVIQPLYQGGRVRALKQQAKAGIMAAREGLRNTEQNLFLSVATAYSDVLRDEETANIRRSNVRVLTRQLTAATVRFDVGEGTRTDIAQAQTRLSAAEIGLAQADAQLQVSRSSS